MTKNKTNCKIEMTKSDRTGPKPQKSKYNWESIWLNFLASNIDKISVFLREVYDIDPAKSSYVRAKIKGWAEKKRKILEEAKEEAKEEVEEEIKKKLVENYKIPIKQLNQMKKTGFELLLAYLSKEASKVTIQVNEKTGEKEMLTTGEINVEKVIKIINKVKIELGEPVDIKQNQLGDDEKELEKDKISAIESIVIK